MTYYFLRITHNGFEYEFVYDGFGNTTRVMVAGNSLIDNYYETRNGNLISSVYGNNHRVDYPNDFFIEQMEIDFDDLEFV